MSARRQQGQNATPTGKLPEHWSTPETRQIIEKMMACCETRDRQGTVAALQRLSTKAAPADAPLTHVPRPRFDPARGAIGPPVHADKRIEPKAPSSPEPIPEPSPEPSRVSNERLPPVPAPAAKRMHGPRESAAAFGARASSHAGVSTSTRADDADDRVLELMARASLQAQPTARPSPASPSPASPSPAPDPEPESHPAPVDSLVAAANVPATGEIANFQTQRQSPGVAPVADTPSGLDLESMPELALLLFRVPKPYDANTYRSEALVEGFEYQPPTAAPTTETDDDKRARLAEIRAVNAERKNQNDINTQEWCADTTSNRLWSLIGKLVGLHREQTSARTKAAQSEPSATGEDMDVTGDSSEGKLAEADDEDDPMDDTEVDPEDRFELDYDAVVRHANEQRAKRRAELTVLQRKNDVLQAMESASVLAVRDVPESTLQPSPERIFIHKLVSNIYDAYADESLPQSTGGSAFEALLPVEERDEHELQAYIDAPFDKSELKVLQENFDAALRDNLQVPEEQLNDGTHGYGLCVDNYAHINAALAASTRAPKKERQALADETAQYLAMLQVYDRIVPRAGSENIAKMLSTSVLTVSDENAMQIEAAPTEAAWKQNLDAYMHGYETHLAQQTSSAALVGQKGYRELRRGADEAGDEATTASTEDRFDVALLRQSFGTPLPESAIRANEAAAAFDADIQNTLDEIERELLTPDVLKSTKRFLAKEQPMMHEPASVDELLPLQPSDRAVPQTFLGLREALLRGMDSELQMRGLGFEEAEWRKLGPAKQRGIAEVVVDFGIQSFLGYANRGRRNWDEGLEKTWLRRQGEDPDNADRSPAEASKHFPRWRLASKLGKKMDEIKQKSDQAGTTLDLAAFLDEFTLELQTWLNCVIEGPAYMDKTADAYLSNENAERKQAFDTLYAACIRVTTAFRESVAAACGLANPKGAHRILVPRSDTGEMPTYGDGFTDDTQTKQHILQGLQNLSRQLWERPPVGKGTKRPNPGEAADKTPGTSVNLRRRRTEAIPPPPEQHRKRSAPDDPESGDPESGDLEPGSKRAKEVTASSAFAERAAFGMVNLLEHLF